MIERRRELALMQAVGFSRRRISLLLFLETSLLLIGGTGLGAVSALIAVSPTLFTGGSSVGLIQPLIMLVVINLVGLTAAALAVRRAMRLPVLVHLQS
ncbi:MAG: FtsX-like permease family protein [Pirellulales bacterium]